MRFISLSILTFIIATCFIGAPLHAQTLMRATPVPLTCPSTGNLAVTGIDPVGSFITAGTYSFFDPQPLFVVAFNKCVTAQALANKIKVTMEDYPLHLTTIDLPVHVQPSACNANTLNVYVSGSIPAIYEVKLKINSGLAACDDTGTMSTSFHQQYVSF